MRLRKKLRSSKGVGTVGGFISSLPLSVVPSQLKINPFTSLQIQDISLQKFIDIHLKLAELNVKDRLTIL